MNLVPLRGNQVYRVLGAGRGVVVAELLAEGLREVAALLELLDDVGAADQLAAHEDLRNRRPAREGREVLPDLGIGKDVNCGDRRTRAPQSAKNTVSPAPWSRMSIS